MTSEEKNSSSICTFWKWFFGGKNGRPGICKLLDWWVLLDSFVGIFCYEIVEKPLSVVAGTVLFPLSSIFIGISLSWSGAAQAIIDSDEIRLMGKYHKKGYAEYPYSFQIAVLIIFFTLALWGVASLEFFDKETPISFSFGRYLIHVVLYGLLSMSLRTCWRMISFSHELLLAKERVIYLKKVGTRHKRPFRGHIRRSS